MAEKALFFTIIFVLGIALSFILVSMKSNKVEDYEEVQSRSYKIRSAWVKILFTLGIVVSLVTLVPFPIQRGLSASDGEFEVINVVGYQWYWKIDKTDLTTDKTYEFNVTSADVTHGFSIYDENDRIITQTQAMPGYVNKLVHKFESPGKYRVLCLEYCGLVHHNMIAEFNVVDSEGGSND